MMKKSSKKKVIAPLDNSDILRDLQVRTDLRAGTPTTAPTGGPGPHPPPPTIVEPK